eukprot:9497976-Pyramimonas_sp.AAC.1
MATAARLTTTATHYSPRDTGWGGETQTVPLYPSRCNDHKERNPLCATQLATWKLQGGLPKYCSLYSVRGKLAGAKQ